MQLLSFLIWDSGSKSPGSSFVHFELQGILVLYDENLIKSRQVHWRGCYKTDSGYNIMSNFQTAFVSDDIKLEDFGGSQNVFHYSIFKQVLDDFKVNHLRK